jgi:hypothetical protein
VRVSNASGAVDVPAGHAATAVPGAAPSAPAPAPDAAERLQRHQDAATPAGLRLAARLEPAAVPGAAVRRLVVRLEKIPGVGLPEMRVSTIGSGLAYLTCTIRNVAAGGADPGPGPVISLDPARMAERGTVRQGVARVSAAAAYEIAGEVDVSALLPRGGAGGEGVITYVCRRPSGEPMAWSGQIAAPPISVPGGGGGR